MRKRRKINRVKVIRTGRIPVIVYPLAATMILVTIFLIIVALPYYSESESRVELATGEPAGQGLPYFITDDMVEELFATQEDYGIPVSTGLAMIIAEGGFGTYGPGGDRREGLSRLSYQYKNLFGIKYWAGMQYATGMVDMTTGEQTIDGDTYYYDSNFAVFASYRDAIRKRTWMLLRSPYFEHLEPHLNPNDGSYTREQANAFMHGIRAGGWATDLAYVEKNIEHMEFYDLYRFDNMTFQEFWAERESERIGRMFTKALHPMDYMVQRDMN